MVLENRGNIESLVISVLLQDISIIADYPLSENDFTFPKTKFFYNLIRELSTKYKEIDEVTVSAFVGMSPSLNESYEKYGGWESIQKVRDLGNIHNQKKYIDDLEKSNLIIRLESKGFNIDKEVEVEGVKAKPIDLFPSMTASQVHDFYEMLLADSSINLVGNDVVIEDLHYTSEEILKKKNNEDDNSASFAIALRWQTDTGEERYVQGMPMLSNIIDGVGHSNGIYFIAGHSGTGKTTFTLNMAMGLVESDCKVLIISNEQQSEYYKQILITYISNAIFNCHTMTRRKVKNFDFTIEEEKTFYLANKFIEEKYSIPGKLKFISMYDFNTEKIKKIAKKLSLSEGYDTLILDTFKAEDASSGNSTGEMNEAARDFDKFGKQMRMRIIFPIQLATYTEGKVSYLTAACISNAKQIKEVGHTITLMRKIIPDELNPEKDRYFLKPYRWKKGRLEGKLQKSYLEIIDSSTKEGKEREFDKNCIDIRKKHILLFVNKTRSGDDDNKILLYEMDGRSGRFIEKAYCDNVFVGQLTY
ncbi:TPA: DnaB-like helicase C-terminal domain-containing protein [Clostridioides difficile]